MVSLKCCLVFHLFLLIFNPFSVSIPPIECDQSNADHEQHSYFSLRSSGEFSLENGNVFQLPNAHRADGEEQTLKFILTGGPKISNATFKSESKFIRQFWLDDGSVIELEIREMRNSGSTVTEWHFVWNGAGWNVNREVCFNYGFNGAKWYNTYQSATPTYPMDTTKDLPRTQFGFHSFISNYPNAEFHSILEYLFLNSDGFALLLDPQCPWFIRYSAQNKANPVMCFSVQNEFPYLEQMTDPTAYLSIKFSIFSAANIRSVHEHVMSPQLGIPKLNKIPENAHFHDWTFGTFGAVGRNEFYYSDSMERFSQLDESKIDYSEYSKKLPGNGPESNRNYPNFGQAPIDDLEAAGFKRGMIVHGIVRQNSPLPRDYFVKESSTDSGTRIIDFSNPKSLEKFSKELNKKSNKISTFVFADYSVKFSNGWAFGLNDSTVQKYPNFYWKNFLQTSSEISRNFPDKFITTSIGFRSQNLPAFIRPSNFPSKSTDEILQGFLKNILAISLGGYSFIDSYVGSLNLIPPTKEQYIRWIQASAPMPHLTLSRLPMIYNDSSVDGIVRKFIQLHHEEYSPVIIELAKSRLQDGRPIVRPMWYGAPLDPRAFLISDQYMLGEDIVVAPVLASGQRDRMVYLPAGEWVDHRGVERSGSGFCKVEVRLDELAIFKRLKRAM